MINNIDLSSDIFYFGMKALILLAGFSFFLFGFCLLLCGVATRAVNNRKEGEKLAWIFTIPEQLKVASGFFLMLMLASYLGMFFINNRPIPTDKWMVLAQAESTLIQLEVAHEVVKDRPNFNFDDANAWIKELRKHTDEKEIAYGSYYALAEKFNDLNVGKETIYRWFSDNPTQTIRKQVQESLENAKQGMQSQGQSVQQVNQDTSENPLPVNIDNDEVERMQKRLSEAGLN